MSGLKKENARNWPTSQMTFYSCLYTGEFRIFESLKTIEVKSKDQKIIQLTHTLDGKGLYECWMYYAS